MAYEKLMLCSISVLENVSVCEWIKKETYKKEKLAYFPSVKKHSTELKTEIYQKADHVRIDNQSRHVYKLFRLRE